MATSQNTSARAVQLSKSFEDHLFDVQCRVGNVHGQLQVLQEMFAQSPADSREEDVCATLRILVEYVEGIEEKLSTLGNIPAQTEAADHE